MAASHPTHCSTIAKWDCKQASKHAKTDQDNLMPIASTLRMRRQEYNDRKQAKMTDKMRLLVEECWYLLCK